MAVTQSALKKHLGKYETHVLHYGVLADTTPEFRETLRKQTEQPQETFEPFIHALAGLAHAAREAGSTAEQLVILVKRELEELERQGILSGSAVHDALRNRVVTSTIKAYYMQ